MSYSYLLISLECTSNASVSRSSWLSCDFTSFLWGASVRISSWYLSHTFMDWGASVHLIISCSDCLILGCFYEFACEMAVLENHCSAIHQNKIMFNRVVHNLINPILCLNLQGANLSAAHVCIVIIKFIFLRILQKCTVQWPFFGWTAHLFWFWLLNSIFLGD